LPGPIIEARELTKAFGDLVAVDHVSFEVKKGEIFGFLGPNGAGKTTTINMLITLLKPTEGEAWVAGFSVLEEPHEVRKRIGVVFQDPTVDRRLTGRENLWIHGRMYGISGSELKERIKEALELVELERWADVVVRKYSGGMVRRLEIARTLLCEPEVLFLDEPTLGLDPQTRAHIWDYIEALRREKGITIFLTTHYMEEADRLCDRVAIIDKGRIIALGTPSELKSTVGLGVVYVRLSEVSPVKEFVRAVLNDGLVEEARPAGRNRIAMFVRDAPKFIPRLFEKASELDVTISEITYHMPTLDDVFLRLTGRGLRDAEAGLMEHIRARMMARFRRGR